MIRIKNVNHRFGERLVLSNVNLELNERRIAIVGANGSGKSTFVRLLNGLLIPDQGNVFVDGLNTREKSKEIRKHVGFVFQDPDNQIVFPVVSEDLAFGLKNLRVPKKEIERRVHEALARYDLSSYLHHSSYLLSGGQKQLIAISSIIVMEPKYIVFDEPTTLLDLRNKRRVSEAISDLEQVVVVVSHDLDFLRDYERMIVFHEGEVVMDDAPERAIEFYMRQLS